MNQTQSPTEKAILVSVQFQNDTNEEQEYSLAELERLVESAGGEVLHSFTQKRNTPDVATYIGGGKLTEIGEFLSANPEIETVVFDNELNPRQVQNLTDTFQRKVIDRTEVILDIFAARAQTKEAKLEVELAQLEYLSPRLTHRWSHLERLGGGIGTRGPGETQLESDRRMLKNRAALLRERLREVTRHREVLRDGRRRRDKKVVSIVGYTNAGKSTLLKALAHQPIVAKDQLFTTLDPVLRKVYLPELKEEVLFSDTVGFVSKLPHQLVNSFKATLEEVYHADLLLHVVDLGVHDIERQINAVEVVLQELAVKDKPMITVFNKIDLKELPNLNDLLALYQPSVAVSALQQRGLADLLALVASRLIK